MSPITELEMRTALIGLLKNTCKSGALLVEEFSIERGDARIDVALVCDQLKGFEIKSDLDTLDRLSNQIHAYNRVFDEITLVVGSEFIQIAPNIIPLWWGLIEAKRSEDGGVTLANVRNPTKNQNQNSQSLASLLWKNEAVDLLQQHFTAISSVGWNKAKIFEFLAQSITKDQIKSWVTTKLRTRTTWRNSVPSALCDDLSHHVAM